MVKSAPVTLADRKDKIPGLLDQIQQIDIVIEMRKTRIDMLPVECISHIISYTSPGDACRSSAVSRLFRMAVDSDIVWDRLLPQSYRQIISESDSFSSLDSMSKKDLYVHLCDHPIIIANGNMSFSLEKQSGKVCYMVGARGLSIAWGESTTYWEWITPPHSRFSQVAELKAVWLLDIKGHIDSKKLSHGTTYAAYFVYQLSEFRSGFERTPVELHLRHKQRFFMVTVYTVSLDPTPRHARCRGDGWMEIEIGDFFIEEGYDADVQCMVREVSRSKSGLIVEGIEFRPKHM